MKIVFVQPPALMGIDNYTAITLPPLGIAYLAAYAREHGHETIIVDGLGSALRAQRPWPHHTNLIVEGLDFDEIVTRVPDDAEVIGVSCMFTHAWPMVRELMIRLNEAFPKAKLIAGGEHVTSMYDTVLRQTPAACCILGEGEITLLELLEAFETGRDIREVAGLAVRGADGTPFKTAKRARIADPDILPWPAWDLVDPVVYMDNAAFQAPTSGRTMLTIASRGCPYRCTFCSSPTMWTQVWKPRDPKKVADEMEEYIRRYGANDFQFQDLTPIVRKDWIIAFCRELIDRKLDITWSLPIGTRSEAINGEVPALLKASGCHHITYAPESGSDRILKAIEKKVNLDHLEQSVRDSLAAGVKVCLFIIIGFPQEEMRDIRLTFAFMRRMARIGVHEVALNTFVPLPGTELFETTNAIEPISIDDEYCYWMTSASSLFNVRSWNPRISARRLLLLKYWGLIQFFGVSYFYHPARVWRLITNAIRGVQETKLDRAIREIGIKIRTMLFRPSAIQATKAQPSGSGWSNES